MTSQSRNKLTIVGTTDVNSVLDRMIDPITRNISDVFLDITDDKSVISDITDSTNTNTVSSAEILQNLEECRLRTELKLLELLPDIIKSWMASENKLPELKAICKSLNIKGIAGLNKDDLSSLIFDICFDNQKLKSIDNLLVISDITGADSNAAYLIEFLQNLEFRLKTESNLFKLKLPECMKSLIVTENKLPELKAICKSLNIKGITGLNKDELSELILNYYFDNHKLKADYIKVSESITVKSDTSNTQDGGSKASTKSKKMEPKPKNAFEELEKQKLEIELKMKEELERQKKIADNLALEEYNKQKKIAKKAEEQLRIANDELERQKKIVEEEIRKKQEEEQRLVEEEKKKEKEEAKKKKQAIPKHVRTIVWNHYIGEDIIKHKCLCCKKVTITNTCFEVGHVLSEKNGGTHEINNLRPICGACNHSMGAENMVDYVVKYGLFIG
jgi:5-methylcytosine-specific restriction endonuclease McrA